MIPEIGQFALVLALPLSIALAVLTLAGAATGRVAWMQVARPASVALALLVLSAFTALAAAFLGNDFSVLYVVSNSNSTLPAVYRFTAVWGGHEGSLLLWLTMLVVWMLAVCAFSRRLPLEIVARVLGVMALIAAGFVAFMLFTSDPFERLLPAALDGRDLNPLLQDPGMVIHPPMLYMGYVGFSVAFAFAIAALLSGRLDAGWARWSRPWTTLAWSFLTVGIALGSAWAYYVLGWGGWWFWDPVENASFMPWLVGTALIHSLAVTEKRGAFKSWTVLLAIFAFALSLLGTFLVRSGVLTSVHAFASDPRRGIFILAFLSIVVAGSLLLYAWRAPKVGLGGAFSVVSRETMLLANNVALVVAAASVLLGTLYPLLLDVLGGDKISVGPPYFDAVFVPLLVPAIFLMGLGPVARWRHASLPELAHRLRWAFAASVAAALVVWLLFERSSWLSTLGYLMAAWVLFTAALNLLERLTHFEGSAWARARRQPASYYGMLVAHVGIGVFIIGVTSVKTFETERDVRMSVGDVSTVGRYTFRFDGVTEVAGPNYDALRGTVRVNVGEREVALLQPEKRLYRVQQTPMTIAAIDTGIARDLYVALGEPADPGNAFGAWSVRIHYKPFVDWIWGGCGLMALGGLLAIADRRYRLARRAPEPAPFDPQAGSLAPVRTPRPVSQPIGAAGAALRRAAELLPLPGSR